MALSGWCKKSFSDAPRIRILPLKSFRHQGQLSSPLIINEILGSLKFKMRIAGMLRRSIAILPEM